MFLCIYIYILIYIYIYIHAFFCYRVIIKVQLVPACRSVFHRRCFWPKEFGPNPFTPIPQFGRAWTRPKQTTCQLKLRNEGNATLNCRGPLEEKTCDRFSLEPAGEIHHILKSKWKQRGPFKTVWQSEPGTKFCPRPVPRNGPRPVGRPPDSALNSQAKRAQREI